MRKQTIIDILQMLLYSIAGIPHVLSYLYCSKRIPEINEDLRRRTNMKACVNTFFKAIKEKDYGDNGIQPHSN